MKVYAKYWLQVLRFGKGDKEPFFIIGTGRSGTHFMDSIMNSHAEITDLTEGQENPFVFDAVTDAAINRRKLPPSILFKYRLLIRAASPGFLVDQSHPNLWHVDELTRTFPQAKFVAMVRCPFSVTFSTLQHSGVSGWLKNYEKYPVPNEFLGITDENKGDYDKYSLAKRSALRWCSHMQKVDAVKRKHPDSVHVMNYELLCQDPVVQLAGLKSFLGLESDFPAPSVNLKSMTKMEGLCDQDRIDIAATVERFFADNSLIDEKFIPVSDYLSRARSPNASNSG